MREFLCVGVIFIFGFAALTGLIVSSTASFDYWQCVKFGEVTGFETKYSGLMCYANVDGQWLDRNHAQNFRIKQVK